MKKKIKFITLGCKVNTYETNKMMAQFEEKGYEITDSEIADVYVINTCTVTNIADRKSRKMIRHYKKQNPNAVVVATGCFVEVNDKISEVLDEVDFVIQNKDKSKIIDLIENEEEFGKVESEESPLEFNDFEQNQYYLKNLVRAVIKVQDGCNNFCSYCIIPYARGRSRSREKQSILNEITELVSNSVTEVIITGIHVASYGKDNDNGYYLIDLLEDVNNIQGLKRIRLGSLEPQLLTEDFLQRLSNLDKVCPNFHISIQSLDDYVLKKMNRKYDSQSVVDCVGRVRKYFPNAIISTDIIVGFPGETDEIFENTFKKLETLRLYKLHVFKYSKRKGTVAEKMDNQVSDGVKEQRSKRLIELSDTIQDEINDSFVGKEFEVLTEEVKDGYIQGHSKEFVKIRFKESKEKEKERISKDKRNKENSFVTVKVESKDMIIKM